MNNKPYKPEPHPMQDRIHDARSIPSLVTGGKPEEPTNEIEPIPFYGLMTLRSEKWT